MRNTTAIIMAMLGVAAAGERCAARPMVTMFASSIYQNIYGLTSDSTALYVTGANGALRNFAARNLGVVGKIPFATGALTTLYTSSNYPTQSGWVQPFQIATDGQGTLFISDPDAQAGTGPAVIIGHADGSAGSIQATYCCDLDTTGIALSGTNIFSIGSTNGRVYNTTTGSFTSVGPTSYFPNAGFNNEDFTQAVIAGNIIYIADSALALGADSTGKQQVMDNSAEATPGIRTISLDGSSGFVELSTGKIPHPAGIVYARNALYVTSGKSIWQVNPTTGAARVYVHSKSFVSLQGITYANGAFYVADTNTIYGKPVNGVSTAKKDGPGIIWKITP